MFEDPRLYSVLGQLSILTGARAAVQTTNIMQSLSLDALLENSKGMISEEDYNNIKASTDACLISPVTLHCVRTSRVTNDTRYRMGIYDAAGCATWTWIICTAAFVFTFQLGDSGCN